MTVIQLEHVAQLVRTITHASVYAAMKTVHQIRASQEETVC